MVEEGNSFEESQRRTKLKFLLLIPRSEE